MEPRSHVIVGDGITALAFLETCARRNLTQVTVIGKSATQIGRGIAYAKGEEGVPWRYAYLLNSPADDIDPVFASWLADNWKAVETKMAGRRPDWLSAAASLVAEGDIYGVNAPREFYGDYMEDRARNIIASLADKSIEVRLVDDIATSLETTDDGVCLHTKAGQIIRAQSADIAPGGPDTMRFDGDDGPFSVPSVFGHEHRVVEHVRNGAEVFCIGGNAAMLDVLRLCQSVIPDEQLKFTFCAPEGEIPPPLVPRLPRKLTKPNLTKGHASAESFLLQVRREIDAAEARGENRREIRAGFRAHFLGHPLSKYVSDTSDAAQVARKLRFWLRGGTRDTIFDMRV
ncbi:MAG: FAD/NAD(P)-binding protein [Pseudomonadota bacterium]